jgi:hypothetical protein
MATNVIKKKLSENVGRGSTAGRVSPVAKKVRVNVVKKPVVKAVPAPVKGNTAVKRSINKTSAEPALEKEKVKKEKLIRDSFTMPEAEYAVLGAVKKACLAAGIDVKKSQLLRIGLLLLSKTEMGALKSLIGGLTPLKAGRPKKR